MSKDAFPLGRVDKYQGKNQIIHRLRELTALPAIDCKKALQENDWDLDKALASVRNRLIKWNDQWQLDYELEKLANRIKTI